MRRSHLPGRAIHRRASASGRPPTIPSKLEQVAYIVLGSVLAMASSFVSNDYAVRRALRRDTRATIYRDILPSFFVPDSPSWNAPPRPRRVSGSVRVPIKELLHLVALLPDIDQQYGTQLGQLAEKMEKTARDRPEEDGRKEDLNRLTAEFSRVADDFAVHLAKRLRGGQWWRGPAAWR